MDKIKGIIDQFLEKENLNILFFLKDFIHHLSQGNLIEIPQDWTESLSEEDLKKLKSCLSLIQENNEWYKLLNLLNSTIYQRTKTKNKAILNRADEVLKKFNELNNSIDHSSPISFEEAVKRVKSRQRNVQKILRRKGGSTLRSSKIATRVVGLKSTSTNVVRTIKFKNGISIQVLIDPTSQKLTNTKGIITPEILKNIESNLE